MCLKVIVIVKEDVSGVEEGIIVEESFFAQGAIRSSPVVQKALAEYSQRALKKLSAKTPSVQKEGARMLKELPPLQRNRTVPADYDKIVNIHRRYRQGEQMVFPNRLHPMNIAPEVYRQVRPALPLRQQQQGDALIPWVLGIAATIGGFIRQQARNNHLNL